MNQKWILAAAGMLLSFDVHGQSARKPFVSATGTASVSATPDQVKIDATVTTQAATAQDAAAQNATAMNTLLAALRKLLGAGGDIKTINYNVYPLYKQSQNQPQAIAGYSASNTVEVTLAGTGSIGSVIDTMSQNGATSLGSLQFGLKDSEPARLQALRTATQQAKNHADSMAAGMGRVVGNILSIQESAGAATPVYAAGGGVAASTPVLAGTLEVQATVVLDAELN